MLFKDLKGRKLVSTATAETVGKVDGFLVDAAKRTLMALEFKKTPQGSIVKWGDLTAVGVDAVTLADSALIVDLDDATEAEYGGKTNAVLKKRVLTRDGEDLGSVKEIEFDPQTGALINFLLDNDAKVAGPHLVGIGSYAVVVTGP